MALIVDQDVPVVPVLDLQDVAHHTVGGQALNEIQPGRHERLARFVSVLLQEVFVEVHFIGLANLITAAGIGDDFNNAAQELLGSCPVADTFVRCDIQVQVTFLEDLLEKLNELDREDVLSKIVILLKDARYDLDRLVDILARPLPQYLTPNASEHLAVQERILRPKLRLTALCAILTFLRLC